MAIPKGLKVGDTFDDYGMTYKVTKVVGENYESVWTGVSSPSFAPVVEKTAEAEAEEKPADIKSLPYATLKKMCAEKGLDARGSKNDLIARLAE